MNIDFKQLAIVPNGQETILNVTFLEVDTEQTKSSTFNYSTLTTEEKAIVDAFVALIKSK